MSRLLASWGDERVGNKPVHSGGGRPRKRKIAVYQTKPEYPSLHIMVTDNPRYWEERTTLDTVEEATERVRQWLERTMK
jgi:hypothetical protein